MSTPTYLVGIISYNPDKKQQKSDSFLTFNSIDERTSHESRMFIYNDTDIIGLDVKRRNENKIKNDKDILFNVKSNQYTSVICKNKQF